ncbi:MAG: hypothetical protein ACREQ5_13305, partial [Candidatus Dormibacteria bacterium]
EFERSGMGHAIPSYLASVRQQLINTGGLSPAEADAEILPYSQQYYADMDPVTAAHVALDHAHMAHLKNSDAVAYESVMDKKGLYDAEAQKYEDDGKKALADAASISSLVGPHVAQMQAAAARQYAAAYKDRTTANMTFETWQRTGGLSTAAFTAGLNAYGRIVNADRALVSSSQAAVNALQQQVTLNPQVEPDLRKAEKALNDDTARYMTDRQNYGNLARGGIGGSSAGTSPASSGQNMSGSTSSITAPSFQAPTPHSAPSAWPYQREYQGKRYYSKNGKDWYDESGTHYSS